MNCGIHPERFNVVSIKICHWILPYDNSTSFLSKFPKIHCNTVISRNSPASKWLILKMFPCQNSKLISCLKNLNYRLVKCHPNVTILTILDDMNIPRSYLSLVTWPLTSSLLGVTIFSKHSVYTYEGLNFNSGNYLFTTDTK